MTQKIIKKSHIPVRGVIACSKKKLVKNNRDICERCFMVLQASIRISIETHLQKAGVSKWQSLANKIHQDIFGKDVLCTDVMPIDQ